MFKQLYCRWRYRRLLRFDFNPKVQYLQLFDRYYRLMRYVSFNMAEYRVRIRYRVTTKSENLGELLDLLDQVIQHVDAESTHIDSIELRYTKRRQRKLDTWLTDDDLIPYDEPEAVRRLNRRCETLSEKLLHLKNKKPALYEYYNQNMQYVLLDLVEVYDALLAMQLSVDRVFNIEQPV